MLKHAASRKLALAMKPVGLAWFAGALKPAEPYPRHVPAATARAQELLREALPLPTDQRADVAAELLASLDDADNEDQGEGEAAWAAEIERRARRVMAGETAGMAWEDVRQRGEAALHKR